MTTTVPTNTELTTTSRNWATLSHLSSFAVFAGIPPVIGPLAMWLLKRDDPFAEHHAKEALNFNISFLIYGVVAALSILLLVGIIALPAVVIAWFVYTIQGAMRASSGEYYEYPLTMRFVK